MTTRGNTAQTDSSGRVPEWHWLLNEVRPFWRIQVAAAVLLNAATLLSLLDPLLVKWLLDKGLQPSERRVAIEIISAMFAIFVLRIALHYIGALSTARAIYATMLRLRLRLVRRIQKLDAAFFDAHATGDLIRRLEDDVDQVGRLAADLLPIFIRIVLTSISTLVIMTILDWRLTCLTAPFVPVLLHMRGRFRPRLEAAADTTRAAVGSRTSFISVLLSGGASVALLGADATLRNKYGRRAVAATRASVGQRAMELRYLALSALLVSIVSAGALAIGVTEVSSNRLTLGGYVAFYTYLTRLLDPVAGAVEAYSALKRAGGSIRRIASVQCAVPELDDVGVEPVSSDDVTEIACRDVSFAYRSGNRVLRHAALRVRRGELLAIVGPSGSGKSTLAKLLLRMHDVSSGIIVLGNRDIREIRHRDLRRLISYVPAQPLIVPGSLRDNVLLGCSSLADAELDRLATIACFDGIVNSLDGRWDHELRAGAMNLSDGERQRLGILRALAQKRPVLVFDEATGALDAQLEQDLLPRLGAYASDKIVVFVTHRPEPQRWASRVITISGGRIAQLSDAAIDVVSAPARISFLQVNRPAL